MRRLLIALLLAWCGVVAAIDPMPFRDDAEAARYQRLTGELRCMVCQNQNIADSDAPLAKDLRREVFELMRTGKSDAEIKQYLADRYGDFVLYRPPFKATTLILWVGPVLVLLVGLAVARSVMLRRGPHPDLPGPIDDQVDR